MVKRVIASDNDEYGIFAIDSTGTVIARNVTGNDGEAGIYVGDSSNADATVWKNVAFGSAFGIFIRDAAHGEVLKNKSFGNCVGILFLNTPEPNDVEDWLAEDNDATANNRGCPGGGDEPALSGIGIAVVGGIDVHVIDNGAFGNKSDPATNSPFSGGIVVVEGSAGTRVESNTALGNDPFDLVWDGTGEGNRFIANDCLTSRPDGLCVDEGGDDDGDDDHDDDDHGDDDDDHDDGDRGEHRRKNGKGDRD